MQSFKKSQKTYKVNVVTDDGTDISIEFKERPESPAPVALSPSPAAPSVSESEKAALLHQEQVALHTLPSDSDDPDSPFLFRPSQADLDLQRERRKVLIQNRKDQDAANLADAARFVDLIDEYSDLERELNSESVILFGSFLVHLFKFVFHNWCKISVLLWGYVLFIESYQLDISAIGWLSFGPVLISSYAVVRKLLRTFVKFRLDSESVRHDNLPIRRLFRGKTSGQISSMLFQFVFGLVLAFGSFIHLAATCDLRTGCKLV